MALVSVIIPTYNRSHVLNDTIASVLRQSIDDFELLIVDDGSTDNTATVVERVGDGRIRYFRKQHAGLAAARNYGISKSQGRYITFLDDDDLLDRDFLEIMAGTLERCCEYDVAYCQYLNIYPDGREKIGFGPERFLSGFLTKAFFNKIPGILPSATMFRKSIFKKFLFDETLPYFEDQDFLLRISATTQFLCIPKLLVKRKFIANNLSQHPFAGTYAILVYERFYRLAVARNQCDVSDKLARRTINRLYRGLAKKYLRAGNRKATMRLFRKAISYYPFDLHDYRGLVKACLVRKSRDKCSDWQMPKPLPEYITALGKQIAFRV